MSMQKAGTIGELPVPEKTTRLNAFRFDYPNRLWFQTKAYTSPSCKTEIVENEGDLTEDEKKIVLDAMRKAMYEVLAAREENKGSKVV